VIVEDLRGLGLSYDLFTRTTTSNHYAVVQDLFRALHRNGYVVARTQMGAISPSTGRTLPDRYVEGTCPICGYPHARGDQCDNCGNQLDPADLVDPRSKINGEVPAFVETEHFFLDLPAFAESLGSWLSTRTDWRPNVLRFATNLVDDLKPRAITRDLDWGVPGAPGRLARPADEAALRLVRRGDRLPLGLGRVGPPRPRPGCLEAVVDRPRPRGATTSWARTTSSSTR
jgi:methionyl-tRNA synthetase